MRASRLKRRWKFFGAVALIVVLGVIGYRLLDKPNPIDYYRVADERTVLVGSESGPNANVRVTNVIETPSSVTITVSGLDISIGPSGEGGRRYESTAVLNEPLGDRTVIDASTGRTVERATCPPPSYFATVCP